jgi:hypothetical protein
MEVVPIGKARLLEGAVRFSQGNVNATYRAQILTPGSIIKSAIVKDLDQRELAIELLVAALGKLLGLRIPNAFLVISNKTLPTAIGPTLTSGERLLFGSEDADTPPIAQVYQNSAVIKAKILKRLAASNEITSLFSFDTWVANVDRHAGNLLISSNGVWFIDHGRCLGVSVVR